MYVIIATAADSSKCVKFPVELLVYNICKV